ncbi:MAG: metallophosphoesterase [Rhodocyclaceae bacterium]|nr:metallophosphoesterase [Rhodocyclaceae bacterium]
MRLPLPLLALSAAALLGGCATRPPEAMALHAWTQVGPDNHLSVRAIVQIGTPCPTAQVDGAAQALSVRAADTPAPAAEGNPAFQPAFAVQSCELDLANHPRRIVLSGRDLPVAATAHRRVAVVGDTGCRIKVPAKGKGDPIQDCTDPRAWPWARIARAAAARLPDLVIHVGDYHYREYCDDPARCQAVKAAGVVIDYGWRGWEADFFAPAAPLLQAAPWVFARGNHENCDRAGEGWQRFLAPRAYRACPNQIYKGASRSLPRNNLTENGYRVDLDAETSLFVADSAGSEDYRLAADTTADTGVLAAALAGLNDMPAGRRVWLLSHKPLWFDLLAARLQPNAWQAASRRALTGQVDLTIAGHEHAFQTLNFNPAADPGYAGGRPAQLIVGGGGTQLESQDPASPLYEGDTGPGSRERARPGERLYEGIPATDGIVLNRFSFLMLEKEQDGWHGTVFDPDGSPITRCRLVAGAKRFDCAFPR